MTSNLKTGSLLFYFRLYPEDNSLHKPPSRPAVADWSKDNAWCAGKDTIIRKRFYKPELHVYG